MPPAERSSAGGSAYAGLLYIGVVSQDGKVRHSHPEILESLICIGLTYACLTYACPHIVEGWESQTFPLYIIVCHCIGQTYAESSLHFVGWWFTDAQLVFLRSVLWRVPFLSLV